MYNSEQLIRRDNPENVSWYSNGLQDYVVSSMYLPEEHILYMSWSSNRLFDQFAVFFKNNDAAYYYSEDGMDCNVSIKYPAADIDRILVKK
jgi:hypothetical protein